MGRYIQYVSHKTLLKHYWQRQFASLPYWGHPTFSNYKRIGRILYVFHVIICKGCPDKIPENLLPLAMQSEKMVKFFFPNRTLHRKIASSPCKLPHCETIQNPNFHALDWHLERHSSRKP